MSKAELIRQQIEDAIDDPGELERLVGLVRDDTELSEPERNQLEDLAGGYLADLDRAGLGDDDLFPEPEGE